MIPIHHSALHAKEGLEPSTTAPNAKVLFAVTNQIYLKNNNQKCGPIPQPFTVLNRVCHHKVFLPVLKSRRIDPSLQFSAYPFINL